MPIKSFLIAFNYNLKYFHLAHFQMCIIFYPSHFLFQIVQRRNSLKAKSYHFFVFLIFLFLLGQFIIEFLEFIRFRQFVHFYQNFLLFIISMQNYNFPYFQF